MSPSHYLMWDCHNRRDIERALTVTSPWRCLRCLIETLQNLCDGCSEILRHSPQVVVIAHSSSRFLASFQHICPMRHLTRSQLSLLIELRNGLLCDPRRKGHRPQKLKSCAAESGRYCGFLKVFRPTQSRIKLSILA